MLATKRSDVDYIVHQTKFTKMIERVSERTKEKRANTRINDTLTITPFAVCLLNAIRIHIDVGVSNFIVDVKRRTATLTIPSNKNHTTNEKMHHTPAQPSETERRERLRENLWSNSV